MSDKNKNPVVAPAGGGSGQISTIFGDGDTTPDVSVGDTFATVNTAETVITQFDSGFVGQTLHLQFGDAFTRVLHGANIRLQGGMHFPSPFGLSVAYETLVLHTKDGVVFAEESRSHNSS